MNKSEPRDQIQNNVNDITNLLGLHISTELDITKPKSPSADSSNTQPFQIIY